MNHTENAAQYSRDAGPFTHKWCPTCDQQRVVPRSEEECPDCWRRLMPVPERKGRRERRVHDLGALDACMRELGVAPIELQRRTRITRSELNRLLHKGYFATPATAYRIAEALGVKVAHLTGELAL